MSMHKVPLTDLEREGLEKHGLVIGEPSQLSDVFRQGVSWALERKVKAEPEELAVWYGSMPESNGKTNWTAILYHKNSEDLFGGICDGFTIDRSEYPDRVRYEADRVRYLIRAIDWKPSILDYDSEKKSDYLEALNKQLEG